MPTRSLTLVAIALLFAACGATSPPAASHAPPTSDPAPLTDDACVADLEGCEQQIVEAQAAAFERFMVHLSTGEDGAHQAADEGFRAACELSLALGDDLPADVLWPRHSVCIEALYTTMQRYGVGDVDDAALLAGFDAARAACESTPGLCRDAAMAVLKTIEWQLGSGREATGLEWTSTACDAGAAAMCTVEIAIRGRMSRQIEAMAADLRTQCVAGEATACTLLMGLVKAGKAANGDDLAVVRRTFDTPCADGDRSSCTVVSMWRAEGVGGEVDAAGAVAAADALCGLDARLENRAIPRMCEQIRRRAEGAAGP